MKINFEDLDVYPDAQITKGYNFLNQEVKKRKFKNIDIFLGGERLYVQPFSYVERYNSPYNKIFYFETDIQPYENYNILSMRGDNMLYECNFFIRIWYWLILRTWLLFKTHFKYDGFRIFNTISWFFNCYVPVIASSNSNIRFSIPYQMIVEDESGLTYTCYLAPSDKWVEEHLELLFKDSSWVKEHEEKYYKYLAWRDEEILKERKIGFLTSIDT